MPADVKSKYGISNQAIVCLVAALANGSTRASTAVDNTVNLFLDALVSINIKTGAAGTSTTGSVAIYAYGTSDGGANYTEGVTGTDAAFTMVSTTNLKLIGVVNAVANAVTYKAGPFSVAQAFGGALPDHWGIVITNNTGGALDAVEGSHLKIYQGVYAQTI